MVKISVANWLLTALLMATTNLVSAASLENNNNDLLPQENILAQIYAEQDENHSCLDIRSLNYRAEVLHPLIGKPIATQRAVFTLEDATPCTKYWDQGLALYVVFSSPYKKNQTFKYEQVDLFEMKADKFELAVETSWKLIPGIYGVEIQIRDEKTQVIKRKTETKTLDLQLEHNKHKKSTNF